MKIAIFGVGTRGDVQPLMSLAWVLRERGHHVTIALPDLFVPPLVAAGLRAVPLGIDVEGMIHGEVGKRALASGDTVSFLKLLIAGERAAAPAMDRAVLELGEGADVLVSSTLVAERALGLSEARGVPTVLQHVFPAPVTGDWAYPLLPFDSLGLRWLNRLSGLALMRATAAMVREDIQRYRAGLGLPPQRGHILETHQGPGLTTALALSPSVVARPADWPDSVHVTGWCDVPAGLRAAMGEAQDPALEAWLDAGPAPVFFGFGSMPVLDPARLLASVRAVGRALGVRALVGAGWSRYQQVDDPDLFVAPRFDHAAVLPRCRAAVHHGGSHTTYASLRAGLPTHIAWVMADQPYWGRRLVAMGVGTTSPFKDLDEAALQRAVQGLLDPQREAAAQALSARLRQEDGLGETVRHVEAARA